MGWGFLGVVLLIFGAIGTPIGQTALESTGIRQSQWEQMVISIEKSVAGYNGEIGIYIKDLRSGRTYERNADEKFASASLIKLPIMAATFQAVHQGRFRLDTPLILKRKHKRGGSGHLRYLRTGRSFPVSYVVYKMITHSDNTAAAMLIDKIGYSDLNRAFRDFGLQTTRIDPVGMRLSDHIHPARENYTTAREMGRLLEKIYDHKLVSDGLSDLMIEILKDADSPTRLARDLPDDWSLARKTGLLRKNCHDVGIVFTDKGDYVICVLTARNETYRKAKNLIASVGKTAYSFIAHS